MSLVAANVGRAALAALLFFTVVSLRRDERTRERTVALAVESRDVASMCGRAGCRVETFLARLRALGVSGLALRPEPLTSLVASRQVVRFNEEEVSRLKATGMAVPGAPLNPGALFVKDDSVARRVEEAGRAQGVELGKTRYGRMGVFTLPEGVELDSLSAGFDPRWAAAAAAAGLTPVYRVSGSADLRLVLDAEGPAAALLDSAPAALGSEVRGELDAAMRSRRMWVAVKAEGTAASIGPERQLAGAEVASDIPLDAFLRLVAGRGPSLVVVGLDPQSGPDAAVAELRRLSRALRKEGAAPAWPSGLFESRHPQAAEIALRRFLAFAAVVFFPLLAVRQGLAASRRVSRASFLPEASPVREAVLGMLAVAVCAAAGGLVIRALCSGLRGGLGPPGWFSGASAVVAGAGFVALWLPDDDSWAALRRADRALLLSLAAAAAGAWLVISPPAAIREWAFGLGPLAAARPGWWWAPARWAEMFVGYPALFMGLSRYARALAAVSQKRAGAHDPRAWLFAGLAAPLGMCAAMMNGRVPLESVLRQSTHCLAVGAALGAALYLGLGFRGRNSAGP